MVCSKSSCKKSITASRFPGLSCRDCSKNFHYQCAGLTKNAFESLVEQGEQFQFSCRACLTNKNNKRRSSIFATLPLPSVETTEPEADLIPVATSVPTDSERISRLEELLEATVNRVTVLEQTNLKLLSESEAKSAVISKLQSELDDLTASTSTIEKSLISDNLEIRNLPSAALEDPISTVISIGEQIDCDINQEDFAINPSTDPKVLRLTFNSKLKRRNFLIHGKGFNKSGGHFEYSNQRRRIHVNEELTAYQKRLYHSAKDFRRTHNFKFAWFDINGLLWLKKCEGSTPVPIRSFSALDSYNESLLSELSRPEVQETEMSAGGSAQ